MELDFTIKDIHHLQFSKEEIQELIRRVKLAKLYEKNEPFTTNFIASPVNEN